MKYCQALALLTALSLLNACSTIDATTDSVTGWFSSDEEKSLPKLSQIDAQFSLQTQWAATVGKGSEGYFSTLQPTHADGRVFVASRNGIVTAFDQQTGQVQWSTNLGGDSGFFSDGQSARLAGGLTVAYNKVFVGSENAVLFALDASNGQLVWQANTPSEALSVPATGEGKVVVYTMAGDLAAFDANTGEQLWLAESEVPALSLRGISSPTINSGGVLVGTASGKLSVTIIESGLTAWEASIASPSGQNSLDRIVDIDAQPIVYAGTVYTISYAGSLSAVELRSGRVIWKREYASYRNLAVDASKIYVTDSQGNVYALDRRTGVESWSQPALAKRRLSSPVLGLGQLIVADDQGVVHVLNPANGEFVARKYLDNDGAERFAADPLVIGQSIILQSSNGKVFALSKAN